MAKKIPLLLCSVGSIILSSCATKHYYHAHLYDFDASVADANKNKPIEKRKAEYSLKDQGAVFVDGEHEVVSVNLSAVYVGDIQRNYDLSDDVSVFEKRRGVYKDKEVWIVCKAESIDRQSPLAPAEVRTVGYTSVKVDQSPNSLIPISGRESEVLKLTADRDYLITMKVYEVDAYALKKIIYENKDSDIAKWVYTTAESAFKTTTNILAGSFVDRLKKSGQSSIEEYLLAAGSDLEFQGTFYLLDAKENDPSLGEGKYALVDILRSTVDKDGSHTGDLPNTEAGQYTNPPQNLYRDKLVGLRGDLSNQVKLNDDNNFQKALAENYIKFRVTTSN